MMSLSSRRVTQRGLLLNEVLQDRISGEVGWQQKSYPLSGDGTHALVWVYSKDSNDTDGSDRGWVDYLQWTPSGGGGGSSTTDWEQITYTYDPSGRRIAKDVDGEVTKYLYDGDQCIAEYDANDVLLRKYVYGRGIDQPICMVEAAGGYAGTYYYHFDALGSVVALSDADGDTVQVYEYDVYGQVAASDPNHPNRFLFTGREFDKETGLYYYRARYYNASIGRFLQTDPIGYADGMNWYAYCGNNTWNLRDPLGCHAGAGLDWGQARFPVWSLNDVINAVGEFAGWISDKWGPEAEGLKNIAQGALAMGAAVKCIELGQPVKAAALWNGGVLSVVTGITQFVAAVSGDDALKDKPASVAGLFGYATGSEDMTTLMELTEGFLLGDIPWDDLGGLSDTTVAAGNLVDIINTAAGIASLMPDAVDYDPPPGAIPEAYDPNTNQPNDPNVWIRNCGCHSDPDEAERIHGGRQGY